MSPDAPRLNLTSPQTSRADWRIVAGAVVVALAIGFFVARALTGGGGSPEVDPDDSVVPQDRDTEQVDE